MDGGAGLTLECDWLPPAEFDRLVAQARTDLPELTVTRAGAPEHRGLDPTIVVATVSGVTTLLVPFVTKLAERLFAAEPRAELALAGSGKAEVVVDATLPPEVRGEQVRVAVTAGAVQVRISLSTLDDE